MTGSRATHPLLEVAGLRVGFCTPGRDQRDHHALAGVDLRVERGEILGVAGESGSGKSTLLAALIRLVPGQAVLKADRLAFQGQCLLGQSEARLREIRGRGIATVFQDPLASLNPVIPVGEQIAEVARVHRGLGRRQARQEALSLLERVHLKDPERWARAYPHHLSGGMGQRVAIAQALAGRPRLLLADEPTTALDMTTQAGILSLFRELVRKEGLGVILVSHDLRVMADVADRLLVLLAGRVVESGRATDVLGSPAHPYTRLLVRTVPRIGIRQRAVVPVPDPDLSTRAGESTGRTRVGCAYAACCPRVLHRCLLEPPPAVPLGSDRWLACHRWPGRSTVPDDAPLRVRVPDGRRP